MPDTLESMFGSSSTPTPHLDEDTVGYDDPMASNFKIKEVISLSNWNRIADTLSFIEQTALSMVRSDKSIGIAYGSITVTVTGGVGENSVSYFDTPALSPSGFGITSGDEVIFGDAVFMGSHISSGTVYDHLILLNARFIENSIPTGSVGTPAHTVSYVPIVNTNYILPGSNTIQIRLSDVIGNGIPVGDYIISLIAIVIDDLGDVI